MRLMVFGAGALGSLVAAKLSNGHDVTLVGRHAHVDAIQRNGLRVSGKTECRATGLRAVTEPPNETMDVVLVTVKAYDTESAVAALRDHWQSSIFVSLQNGLGNEEAMASSATRVLGGVINQGVTFEGPGAVFHAGVGETVFGPHQRTTLEDARALADVFAAAGLPSEATENIHRRIWEKVVLNAAVNPITALLRKRTGELLDDADLEEAIEAIVEESVAIAKADGAAVETTAILEKISTVAAATRENKSSMLQDLERGRRTEIAAINGALVERARALGCQAPLNQVLNQLIRSAERNKTAFEA